MAFERVGATLIAVHNLSEPTDADWRAWIARMGQRDYHAVLVVSPGGGPSASQRAQATAFWQGKEVPKFAFVTRSLLVRSILLAFHWLSGRSSRTRVYAPEYLAKALDFLEVAPGHFSAVEEVVRRMEAGLENMQGQRLSA